MIEAEPLLVVDDLHVSFRTEQGLVEAVRGVSFELRPGEVLGVVGESGSGKSATGTTLLGLNRGDPNASVHGSVRLDGRELLELGDAELRRVRGAEIAMIFQDPMTSLTPVYTVGSLIAEVLRAHVRMSARVARRRAIELLTEVGIPEPSRRVDDYPHQFSGGMRQRVMIAMALACEPRVLVADEPTTALDVTIQAQILKLIARLREERGSAVILITHDLGVIAEVADRIAVMYAGRFVEEGPAEAIFVEPQHPYTCGLLGSIPRIDRPRLPRLQSIAGQPPTMIGLGEGCSFASRCAHAFERCAQTPPLERRYGGPGHRDACWLAAEARPTVVEAHGAA